MTRSDLASRTATVTDLREVVRPASSAGAANERVEASRDSKLGRDQPVVGQPRYCGLSLFIERIAASILSRAELLAECTLISGGLNPRVATASSIHVSTS
jgi:hypothetical protein